MGKPLQPFFEGSWKLMGSPSKRTRHFYVTGGVTLSTRGFGYDLPRGVLTSLKVGTATTSLQLDAGLNDSARVFPGSGGTVLRTFGNMRAPVKITSTAAYGATIERWIGYNGTGRIAEHLTAG